MILATSGSNKVHVGNGTGLKVHHIGSSVLQPSDTASSSHKFLLTNLLHVPQITKNLISVTFAKDNIVFFEFHPFYCFAKDIKTGQVLLEGKVSDGLPALLPLQITLFILFLHLRFIISILVLLCHLQILLIYHVYHLSLIFGIGVLVIPNHLL